MPLIIDATKSLKKGDKVIDLKALILDRGSRKFWYIKCQMFFENDIQTLEESTKVLKTEKSLKYMQMQYLPAWIARKKEELKLKKHASYKFSFFYEKYLESHKDDKGYFNRLPLYKIVNQQFGNHEVNKITRQAVKEFLAELKIKGDSKKKYLACIKGTLDIALDSDIVFKNVATDITFKKEPKKDVKPFSGEEVSLLLEKSDDMFKNFIGIALHTGMRSGEILGLMHQDIKDDRICVRRSISRGNIKSPKTDGSIRDIPLFEAVKPFIEDQIKRSKSKSLFLFNRDGDNIEDVSFFRNQWKALIKSCNIKYRTIYNTRHTFITAMLNSGKFKIMDIAAIVGHTSPQMIMTHYAGFVEDCHLKVDTTIDLFSVSDKQGDTLKLNIR